MQGQPAPAAGDCSWAPVPRLGLLVEAQQKRVPASSPCGLEYGDGVDNNVVNFPGPTKGLSFVIVAGCLARLRARSPQVWLNPHAHPSSSTLSAAELHAAADRLASAAPLLKLLFPSELDKSSGIIESSLRPCAEYRAKHSSGGQLLPLVRAFLPALSCRRAQVRPVQAQGGC